MEAISSTAAAWHGPVWARTAAAAGDGHAELLAVRCPLCKLRLRQLATAMLLRVDTRRALGVAVQQQERAAGSVQYARGVLATQCWAKTLMVAKYVGLARKERARRVDSPRKLYCKSTSLV